MNPGGDRARVLAALRAAPRRSGVDRRQRLERLLGTARTIGEGSARSLARGARVHVASLRADGALDSRTPAGLTVVDPAKKPRRSRHFLGILEKIPRPSSAEPAETFDPKSSRPRDFCVATLGDQDARRAGGASAADLSARLGQEGLCWQAIARGEECVRSCRTFRGAFRGVDRARVAHRGFEPLSFVLNAARAALDAFERRRSRCGGLHVCFASEGASTFESLGPEPGRPSTPLGRLSVSKGEGAGSRDGERVTPRETHARRLELPSPVRDVRTPVRWRCSISSRIRRPRPSTASPSSSSDARPRAAARLFTRAHRRPNSCHDDGASRRVMGQGRIGALPGRFRRPGAFEMMPFPTVTSTRSPCRGDHAPPRAEALPPPPPASARSRRSSPGSRRTRRTASLPELVENNPEWRREPAENFTGKTLRSQRVPRLTSSLPSGAAVSRCRPVWRSKPAVQFASRRIVEALPAARSSNRRAPGAHPAPGGRRGQEGQERQEAQGGGK